MKNIDEIIKSLTIEEKASLLCGAATMETKAIPEKGIRSLVMSDGPNGIRRLKENNDGLDISDSAPATSFPTGASLAMTWNKDILYKVGERIADECLYFGIDAILGPSMNIKRNPLCGRNFEYYSEDPLVAGVMGSAFISGVQSKNIIATPKHFACNNNERFRFTGNSVVDERALREIYLKPFEMAVKNAKPRMIMTAYNQINGDFASQNKHISYDILRKEWGFDGISVTDWGGVYHRDEALLTEQDLEMPGMVEENINRIIEGYKNGVISEELIDKSLRRILRELERTENNKATDYTVFRESQKVAIEAANESIVLLRNNGILPLKKDMKISAVGHYFDCPRFQGGGSSLINPIHYFTLKDDFDDKNINYVFSRGFYDNDKKINTKLAYEAFNNSKKKDVILFFFGQSDYYESEGFDRDSMKLPEYQIDLFNSLKDLGVPIVGVLFGGSAVEIPFVNELDALLYVGLPGQVSGFPISDVLFGEVNPSGRLIETWPYEYTDNPTSTEFTKTPIEIYKESIFVGYRYYLSADVAVMFPFGYGLSYTDFKYDNLRVVVDKGRVIATVDVTNIGNVKGKDVVQLYVSKPKSDIFREKRALKAFAKVEVDVGETKEVELEFSLDDLKVFDIPNNRYVLEDGEYLIQIAKDASYIILKEIVYIKGEKIASLKDECPTYYGKNIRDVSLEEFAKLYQREVPVYKEHQKPNTLETPFGLMKGKSAKFILKIWAGMGKKMMKNAYKIKDPLAKQRALITGNMLIKSSYGSCLRSTCFCSSGALTYKRALGLLDLSNGHFIKGLKKMK